MLEQNTCITTSYQTSCYDKPVLLFAEKQLPLLTYFRNNENHSKTMLVSSWFLDADMPKQREVIN
mgnify:CR=1 FL=1|jgi:hypothetical protein